jgi:hypothetical protein
MVLSSRVRIRAFEIVLGHVLIGLRTVVGSLRAGRGAFVAGVARDTHDCGFCRRRVDVSFGGSEILGEVMEGRFRRRGESLVYGAGNGPDLSL